MDGQLTIFLKIAHAVRWAPYEKTLLDIRVTHPNAPYQCNKPLEAIYRDHENEKKRAYLDRVINIEKATFVPVVLTTSGGYAPEAQNLVKRMAVMISTKKKEAYSDVMRHLRTKIRFRLLKTTLIAIRGYRGPAREAKETMTEEIDFNLIPTGTTMDSW